MIVAAIDAELPFLEGPALSLSGHSVFGSQMVGEQAMSIRLTRLAEQGQATRIPLGHLEPTMQKRFPIVHVKDSVSNPSAPAWARPPPIEAHSLTRPVGIQ